MGHRKPLAGTFAAVMVVVAGLVMSGSASVSSEAIFDDGGVVVDDRHVHGDMAGRLDTTSSNVALIGRGQIDNPGENRVSDVGILGNYAYLGAFNSAPCQGGVYIMDISDVRQPRQAGFIASSQGSFVGEGVHPLSISTRHFRGDLLAYSNELCTGASAPPAVGGATLVDISNPLNPVVLTNGFGAVDPSTNTRARTVHSTFMWQTGFGPFRLVYIVLPDSSTPMLPIFDITDPRNPKQVIDINVAERFPQILQPDAGLDTVFFHDVVVRRQGTRQIMLLSVWDAGYVKLDVTNPARPIYLGDSDFTFPDPELKAATGEELQPEGNGHYAEFVDNGKYILSTDEDFSATRLSVQTNDGGDFRGAQGGAASLPTGGNLTGTTVFGGLACNTAPPPQAPAIGGPYVALVERGGCPFTEKAVNVESRGYAGTVVFNRTGPGGGCAAIVSPTVTAAKPYFSVSRKAGLSLVDADAGYDEAACTASTGVLELPLGTIGDVVTIKATFDGWGYVHLLRNENGKMRELDTYAVPQGMDPGYENGFGNLTVHEVAVSAKKSHLAYLAYYDAGFRVISVKHGKIKEVGHFVDVNGNDFWGVQVFNRHGREYVLASDRDFGLYIFEYTGRD
jgi:hypothetical protein